MLERHSSGGSSPLVTSGVRQAFFLLADISGYTSFIENNELEHAQEVMGNLLNLLVDELTPTAKLVEIEGDAVFVYALEDRFPRGETLVELIESTYVRFRDSLLEMQRDTTCTCRACRSIPELDLKFVVNFGEFALQDVAGRQKPVGSAVNLAHRLLKNGVAEATGWQAYALLTDSCLKRLGLEPKALLQGEERYEHLGSVPTWTLDLRERHIELVRARHEDVPPEGAHMVLRNCVAAPPPVVWAWLNTPELRGKWFTGTTWTGGLRPGGRTGVGAENHCAHSTGTAVERIVEWHPFESFTTETRQGVLCVRQTWLLRATEEGTELEVRSRIEAPFPRLFALGLGRLFFRVSRLRRSFDTFERLVGEEASI